MSGEQLEDQAELLDLASDDQFLVNDVSDTTDDLGGTAKRISPPAMAALLDHVTPGAISRDAALEFVSLTSVKLSPGWAMVDGALLEWASDLTWSGTAGTAPLNAAQVVYAYLYDDAGTPALEVSATGPEADSANDAWRKTGDSTRRWVGYFRVLLDGTYKIANWANIVSPDGRCVEVALVNGLGVFPRPVNGGTQTSWTAINCAPYIPDPAVAAMVSVRAVAQSGNDVAVAVDCIDTGQGAVYSPYAVRFRGPATNSAMFPGQQWVPIVEPQTLYYRIANLAGSGGLAYIDIYGARFLR